MYIYYTSSISKNIMILQVHNNITSMNSMPELRPTTLKDETIHKCNLQSNEGSLTISAIELEHPFPKEVLPINQSPEYSYSGTISWSEKIPFLHHMEKN